MYTEIDLPTWDPGKAKRFADIPANGNPNHYPAFLEVICSIDKLLLLSGCQHTTKPTIY